MKRDTVKTFAGLIIIGGIVVATFLYGNSQRQAQLAKDNQVKQQQAAKTAGQATAAQPGTTATASAGASNNTAPVKSPTSNAIQGSTAQTATPKATGNATSTITSGAATPAAGATGAMTPLPETGPEMAGILGMGSIAAMLVAVRGSRRDLLRAARTRR